MVDTVKCLYCNGAGGFSTTSGQRVVTCPDCKGTGQIPGYPYDANKGWERLQKALEKEGDK